MCGISGLVTNNTDPAMAGHWIAEMNSALSHRGRDGSGTWVEEGVAFGHRRLSIIDLTEHAKQPIASSDGSCILVCNGEIYNYKELRHSLDGYNFKSESDVEVILPLYQKFGVKCLSLLTGMFAFALWDRRFKTLFLARDRVGEKPLFYSVNNGCFAFSSEPKGLLCLPFIDKRINEEAIPLLLTHQSLPAPVTMYRGIHLVPPSSYIVWSSGNIRRERYWNLDFSQNAKSSIDYNERYEALVYESVRDCATADVPVGVSLSGGVDSTTIALMVRKFDSDAATFSLDGGSDIEGCQHIEMERAQRAASLLGMRHDVIKYALPDLDRLPEILRQYDQPIWSLPILYSQNYARAVSSKVKVVLTGNGADEVFGGYAAYAKLPRRQKFGALTKYLPLALTNILGDRAPDLARFLQSTHKPFWAWRGEAKTLLARTLMKRMCTEKFYKRWSEYEAGFLTNELAQECNPKSLVDVARFTDLMIDHQHGHALIPDISGMQNGLEMRSPFLNHNVIEFAASLPDAQTIPWPYKERNTKYIMKNYLSTKLPNDFVFAKKIGFGFDVNWDYYLFGAGSKPVRDILLKGNYLDLGIFSREGAEWALDFNRSARLILLCFAIWADSSIFGNHSNNLRSYGLRG